jgi:hypothetical protein
VRCSVMSPTHRRFGAVAVKSRCTRSSWTGGPALVFLPRVFFPNADHQALSRQIFHAVRAAIASPDRRAS